jgi:hypothetical protein
MSKDLINIIDVAKYDQHPNRDEVEKWYEEMGARIIDEHLAELAKKENEYLEYGRQSQGMW